MRQKTHLRHLYFKENKNKMRSEDISKDKENRSYLWVTENPQGTKVAVAEETLKVHVLGDHPSDKSRELSYPLVKEVIENPKYIYGDQNYEKNKRVRYSDQVYIKEYGHIQNLVVVVDTDREPNEVATWMVKSNTKQEKINGGVMYDSRSNTKQSD
jgi:hypothetical protein